MSTKTKTQATENPEGKTRLELIEILRDKGYDGPVSYGKTRLVEILGHVEAGTLDQLDFPRRGRPKQADDDQEGTPKAVKATPAKAAASAKGGRGKQKTAA